MKHDFWAQTWAARQIGFHLNEANPRLVPNVSELGPPGRVLVPLCGKTLDMAFLASRGFEVEGVEFVEEAAQAFFAEANVKPERQVQEGFIAYRHGAVRIWVADVFALPPTLLAPVDAIYDRAALVALEPPTRPAYVQQLKRLSRPEAPLLLVTFEHDAAGGPPFSVEPEDARRLLEPDFNVRLLERLDVRDQNPRFRERGMNRIHEAVWVGRRVP